VIALCAEQSDMYGAGIPLWIQMALVPALAPLARALGYDRKLAVYMRSSADA
jgi:hypothetical protein